MQYTASAATSRRRLRRRGELLPIGEPLVEHLTRERIERHLATFIALARADDHEPFRADVRTSPTSSATSSASRNPVYSSTPRSRGPAPRHAPPSATNAADPPTTALAARAPAAPRAAPPADQGRGSRRTNPGRPARGLPTTASTAPPSSDAACNPAPRNPAPPHRQEGRRRPASDPPATPRTHAPDGHTPPAPRRQRPALQPLQIPGQRRLPSRLGAAGSVRRGDFARLFVGHDDAKSDNRTECRS